MKTIHRPDRKHKKKTMRPLKPKDVIKSNTEWSAAALVTGIILLVAGIAMRLMLSRTPLVMADNMTLLAGAGMGLVVSYAIPKLALKFTRRK